MNEEVYAALVGKNPGTTRTRHMRGLPPMLTGGEDMRVELPATRLVVLVQRSQGFLLVRYSIEAEFAGDTWHPTRSEAEDQAAYEFGKVAWTPVQGEWSPLQLLKRLKEGNK